MDEKLKQKMQEQLARRPSALEIVREFLRYRVWGAEPEDVEAQVRSFSRINAFKVKQTIEAIEVIAAGEHPEGLLSELVMIEGNQVLADESDTAAREWLRELARQMREWSAP
jgi:hypothetical protein